MQIPSRILLILLGAPNTDDGILLPVALSRCELVCKLYATLSQPDIVLTGGYGDHFNRTNRPHWSYLKENLLAHAVSPSSIIDTIDTRHTIDDISMLAVQSYVKQYSSLIFVTSDFHVCRVGILACRLVRVEYSVIGARTPPIVNYDELLAGEFERLGKMLG